MEYKKIIESYKDEMLETLKDVLAYKSVSVTGNSEDPYGKETHECLKYILNKAASFGFKVRDLDGQIGWCEYGEGSEMEAVLCHLDVVPAGDGWKYEAFAGTVVEDRIYGRGTTDDKGPAVAALYALKAVKESGVKLNKRIRIIFGCDEERGCGDVKYYKEAGEELPVCGFTPDGDYPLINGEKGIIIEKYKCEIESGVIKEIRGGTAVNMVPGSAHIEFENGSEINVEGKCAHGSTPEEGENAISKMLINLNDMELPEKTKKAISFLAEKIGMEYDGKSLGIKIEDEISGPLTFNLGTIDSDGETIEVGVNYRYPVTMTSDSCVPAVQKQFSEAGFELVESEIMNSLYVPEDAELVKTLIGIYNSYMNTNAGPISIGGGTYAKKMPNIVAFGPIFPGEEVTEHQANEYITIKNLLSVTTMNAMAMEELAK